ncbi:MAG: DUF4145 domain-containing protein [Phycisphaerales bacterium]|nr:DUF4145 domain-containing protein [Phycisphaerales bacterium]
MADVKPVKAHCNKCFQETNHDLLHRDVIKGNEYYDGSYELQWSDTNEMIRCRGCDSVRLRNTYWFSEWDGAKVTYYPPSSSRRPPTWLDDVPEDEKTLLEEVYAALHADSLRLALMGARAACESLIIDKVGDQGDFKRGLDALCEKRWINDEERVFLQQAIDAGSAAIHRGFKGSHEDVTHVLDIVESLYQRVYVLPKATAELGKRVPRRPLRKSTSTPPAP